jgi:hypothetical protein
MKNKRIIEIKRLLYIKNEVIKETKKEVKELRKELKYEENRKNK